MIHLHEIALAINYWVTGMGEQIPVWELTDEHIENIQNWSGRIPELTPRRRRMLEAVRQEAIRRNIPWN
jgi:hypothetical protein